MLFNEGGVTPQTAPQTGQDALRDLANGTNTHAEVSPTGGEGLWNMAQQMHGLLDADMKKTNSVESIFGKLRDNAIEKHGFAKGSDDGKLPAQYQGNQKSGRDLDLIYASDKFQIDLSKPAGSDKSGDAPKADKTGINPQENGLYEKNQAEWNAFSEKNPGFADQYKGMDKETQSAFVTSFNKAAEKGPTEIAALGELIKTDGFHALDHGKQRQALQLADTAGAKAASDLVDNAGFKTLKGTQVPSRRDDDDRDAQALVLDKAVKEPAYLKALQNAMSGEGGFDKVKDPQHMGQAMVFMAAYTSRDKGYKAETDNGSATTRGEILQRLWNNVLAPDHFNENTSYQIQQVDDWVGRYGWTADNITPQV